MLVTQLTQKLVTQLNWNVARINCLSTLIISVLNKHTVNLVILATEASGDTKCESLYRRFQNFFLKFNMPLDDIGELVISKLPKPKEGWVLSMDRTNWKYGRTHINILVVGIVINKVAFPIVWRVLPQATKRGNSNTTDRIKIMKRVLSILPAKDIRVLAMDREFCGKKWLKWIDAKSVKYVLRIKCNVLVGGKHAGKITCSKKLKSARLQAIWESNVFFSGCRITGKNTRDKYLYVVSNYYNGNEALGLYKKRWGIEQVFSHFKKRGFDLETTHMSDGGKIEKLFGVLTLAFLISYGWGCEMTKKTLLTNYQKRKSIFRLGLDRITNMLTHRKRFDDDIMELLEWFCSEKYRSIFVV